VNARKTDLDYCAELVKSADPDRYLASLFAPRPTRQHLLALYAFNVEVARIRDVVSEPTLGEIRLAWWRETVAAIYDGEIRHHPVVEGLAAAIDAAHLPAESFLALIAARRADFEFTPFASEDDLDAYIEATSSMLMAMAAMIEMPDADRQPLGEASRPAGRAWALTGLLRALPFHARRGQIFLPQTRLHRHRLAPDDILAGRHTGSLADAMNEWVQEARDQLAEMHRQLKALQKIPVAAFLPTALCRFYLRIVERPGFDPFTESTDIALVKRQFVLLGRGLIGRL